MNHEIKNTAKQTSCIRLVLKEEINMTPFQLVRLIAIKLIAKHKKILAKISQFQWKLRKRFPVPMHNLVQTLHNVKLMTVELLDTWVTCKPFFYLIPQQSSVSDNNTVEGKYAVRYNWSGINKEYDLQYMKIIEVLSVVSYLSLPQSQ